MGIQVYQINHFIIDNKEEYTVFQSQPVQIKPEHWDSKQKKVYLEHSSKDTLYSDLQSVVDQEKDQIQRE